jgi:chemotaxis response regulator CheB
MPVVEVKQGMSLEPNRVFVMPPAMYCELSARLHEICPA